MSHSRGSHGTSRRFARQSNHRNGCCSYRPPPSERSWILWAIVYYGTHHTLADVWVEKPQSCWEILNICAILFLPYCLHRDWTHKKVLLSWRWAQRPRFQSRRWWSWSLQPTCWLRECWLGRKGAGSWWERWCWSFPGGIFYRRWLNWDRFGWDIWYVQSSQWMEWCVWFRLWIIGVLILLCCVYDEPSFRDAVVWVCCFRLSICPSPYIIIQLSMNEWLF